MVRATIPSFRSKDPEEPDQAELARLPDEPFILFVGAIRKVKGVEILLEAYARLASPPPLVLLGTEEPDTPSIMPGGVVRVGPMSHASLMRAWDRSLFGVMPSLWPEPLGSAVHEAMSRGRAVIGSTPGGHSDMIRDGESGLLVPSGDSVALAGAMARLLDEPNLRGHLGKQARQTARRFDAAALMPRYEALYEAVLRVRGADPARVTTTF